jgi:hypothetical protein
MQRRKQQQHRIKARHRRHALGGEASYHPSDGARRSNPAVGRSGPCRIETFRNERPEAGQKECGDAGEMKIDDNDDESALVEVHPFGDMSHRAHRKRRRDHGERREPPKKP